MLNTKKIKMHFEYILQKAQHLSDIKKKPNWTLNLYKLRFGKIPVILELTENYIK